MLAQFGGQPQPVRRIQRSRSLGPSPAPSQPSTVQATAQVPTTDLVPHPRLARTPGTASPIRRSQQESAASPLRNTADEGQPRFTSRSTYQEEFRGKAQQLAHQQVVPVAGATSEERNVSRTRRCRHAVPRDSLAQLTMTVVTARKPADSKSVVMHGGYYGEDGQWRVCKSKRRNEESFNTAFRINERELREVMQPLENVESVRAENQVAQERLRHAQRFRATELDGEDGKFIFGKVGPPPFRPSKRIANRSQSVPLRKTGPENRLLDYAEDWKEDSRGGRRLLYPAKHAVSQPPEDGFHRQRKAQVPTSLADHADLLHWPHPERPKPEAPTYHPVRAPLGAVQDVQRFLADRDATAQRRAEQRQKVETLASALARPSDAAAPPDSLVTRIAELRGKPQQQQQQQLTTERSFQHASGADAPLAVGANHGGTMDVLRGRRMGYLYSCQADSDPIAGVHPVSAIEQLHVKPRPERLRTFGFYRSHHLDHDPLSLRPLMTEEEAGAVRRTRSKSMV